MSSNGEMAGLWLIEWNGTSVVQARLVANGGGTNKWETLEALVTLHPSTTTASLRLVHHITSGSFFWDDVSFWRYEAGRRCADMRHYIIQSTPGFSMRQDPRCGPLRLDGRLNASGEFVTEYSHGVRDFTTYSGTGAPGPDLRIGIHKTVGDGLWRCFADPGEL
ncbi:MAG TPA: hypothetical protein VNW71_06235, partial [Thermoanaerobaculia bacterium]|nr:hypothetical protein [Thermoanaerobaculia bacterium]